MEKPIQVQVRAMPAPGHEYRRRAGRAWSRAPVTVKVVDHPISADEISPAQYAALQADPHIAAMPLGGGDDGALVEVKADLLKAQSEVEQLRKQLAEAAEIAEEQKRVAASEIETAGQRIRQLEAELELLREKLAKRVSR